MDFRWLIASASGKLAKGGWMCAGGRPSRSRRDNQRHSQRQTMSARTKLLALIATFAFAAQATANEDVMAIADVNQDGKLTDAEARNAVNAVRTEANAVDASDRGKRLLAALDTNKDKKVDEAEANAGVVESRRGTAQGRRLDDLFVGLDENKDGVVDKREFEKMPDKIGFGGRWLKRRTGEMFRDLDANGDGRITPAEAHANAGVLGPRFGGRGRDDAPETAAPPADPLRDVIERQFALLDRDKDQKLSDKEFRSNKDLRVRAKQMDLDLDEELSVDEIYAFYKAHPPEK
jgi:Ca2+-binding EF-hand superfamily protein